MYPLEIGLAGFAALISMLETSLRSTAPWAAVEGGRYQRNKCARLQPCKARQDDVHDLAMKPVLTFEAGYCGNCRQPGCGPGKAEACDERLCISTDERRGAVRAGLSWRDV